MIIDKQLSYFFIFISNFITVTAERLDERVENLPVCSGLAALFTINLKSPDLPKCLPADKKLRDNVSSGLLDFFTNIFKFWGIQYEKWDLILI